MNQCTIWMLNDNNGGIKRDCLGSLSSGILARSRHRARIQGFQVTLHPSFYDFRCSLSEASKIMADLENISNRIKKILLTTTPLWPIKNMFTL